MVKQLLMNLVLSFTWVALTGFMNYPNFLFGFLLGFLILWILNRNEADTRYFSRVPNISGFLFYFMLDLVSANILVAFVVLTVGVLLNQCIVRLPLSVAS